MNKEERFVEELEHDIKKKTLQMSIDDCREIKFLANHKLLKCCGFKIGNEQEFAGLVKYIMAQDNCGKYLETYNCLLENTMFYLTENNGNISGVNFSYLNTDTTTVFVNECNKNNIYCSTTTGEVLRFEAKNQNEFEFNLANKEIVISASCFAGRATIKENNEKNEKISNYYKETGKNTALAQLSGTITKFKKNLNTYSNMLYDEITINCYGISIAVVTPSGLVDEAKIKVGNILICSGLLTAIILRLDSRALEKDICISGIGGLKKYLITITKNRNALVVFNLKRNGETNEKRSYLFPTRDIVKIKLKPYYNMLYNYQMKVIVKKGKNFKCYLTASNSEVSKMLNELDVDVEM